MKVIRRNTQGDESETVETREHGGTIDAAAAVKPSSWRVDDAGNRFVDVVLSDERTNTVRRYTWDGAVDVQLAMEPDSVAFERLNGGAPFLRVHRGGDDTAQIGKFVEGSARIDGDEGSRELVATVQFSRNLNEESERIVADVADGIRRNVSVGFRSLEVAITERDGAPDHHLVTRWEPMEGSLVPMGADPGAQIRSATQPPIGGSTMPPKKDTTQAAADLKVEARYTETDVAELAEQRADEILAKRAKRKTELQGLGRALNLDETRVGELIDERGSDGKPLGYDAIVEREINAAAKRDSAPASAIRPGVSVTAGDHDETDIRELRALGYILAHRDGQSNEAIRQALKSNKDVGKRFIARGVDVDKFDFLAEGRRHVGSTIPDIARACLEAEGISTRGMGRSEVLSLALGTGGIRGRGLNVSASFPLLLAETFNTSVRIGFMQQPLGFDRWTVQKNASDFRTMYEVTMGEGDDLEEIPEKGLIPTSSMGEIREGHAIKMHGKIFGVTHKLLVNDHLGGITDIPRKFGLAGNRLMRATVIGLLTANGNLSDGLATFTNGAAALRTINDEGTPSVVSVTSVDAMATRFATRMGVRADVIAPHTLQHIITSRRRRTLAKQVLGQLIDPRTLARADGTGIANQVTDDFDNLGIHSDPLIDAYNSGTGLGNSWYGTDGQSIVWSYLEGEEGVAIAVKENFETLGMSIRATLPFGAGIRDWRGVDRNTGA